MILSPAQKFLVLMFAAIAEGLALIWAGIKLDILALGMNEHVYNIGVTLTATFSAGATGLLLLLGLRTPTTPKEEPADDIKPSR